MCRFRCLVRQSLNLSLFLGLFGFLSLSLFSSASLAQEDLLNDRWLQVQTDHFTVLSQVPARQTNRFAAELETWRLAAAQLMRGDASSLSNPTQGFPEAQVPTYVYLFADEESYQHFTLGQELGFFYSSPRSNFMALLVGNEDSLSAATHHYAHFLARNFLDLRLPRWYEEGLASYMGRVQIDRGRPEFKRFTRDEYNSVAGLSETLSMDRLLFREDALASPRVIQIANFKSESLLYYLLHGYQEAEFIDRRKNLADYLELVVAGRNPRFAYDRAFDVTTEQLDAELHYYLRNSDRPTGTILSTPDSQQSASKEPESLSAIELALGLGELALNAGLMEIAEFYFQAAVDTGLENPRSYSGLSDAQRFQDPSSEDKASDQTVAARYQQALELDSSDTSILLDYGEYWEAELADCDKIYPANQRALIVADIKRKFELAFSQAPDSPETNLSMGLFYLFEGEDWQLGLEYQTRAFDLLPADTFIMEQAVKYAIVADDYVEAERLIGEMAQPIHFWGEPGYVTDLRVRLMRKRRSEPYDACAED